MKMEEIILSIIISIFVGVFLGYVSSIIQRRFRAADTVCELLMKEIKEASELHDNIDGELCISKWLGPSKRRIQGYLLLVDWNDYLNGPEVLRKFNEFEQKKVSILYRREHILEDLCQLYRLIKKTT
jgi:hypothetical protein